jgi:hypothetical protein
MKRTAIAKLKMIKNDLLRVTVAERAKGERQCPKSRDTRSHPKCVKTSGADWLQNLKRVPKVAALEFGPPWSFFKISESL